ncbi:NAD-dependent epimerase/dehydratase family protein [Georgenia alba]|uniref:NAD-dependent epimerase/dehydratase family protein n=1 Tax=Georgenia alba TaxID=2233858 RepID=A0ABW2Q3T8_9MICO
MSLHVIVGAGPVGSTLALQLADAGHDVRILTRSGRGPDHPRITRVRVDAADPASLTAQTRGATVLYNCANPPSYTSWEEHWPPLAASILEAAEATGAVLAITGNLYGYGPVPGPMTRDLPLAATDHKGRLRARMWADAVARHRAGAVRVAEVRAADYVGAIEPMNSMAVLYATQAVRGRPVLTFGPPDVPHTFTYVPDVARTLAAVALDERSWGQAWHVPSPPTRTVREVIGDIAAAAGARRPWMIRIPRPLLRLSYPVVPLMREIGDLLYQWDRPYVLDAAETTRTFGVEATPWDEVVAETAAALTGRSAVVTG